MTKQDTPKLFAQKAAEQPTDELTAVTSCGFNDELYISLHYNDQEKTPAIDVPYLVLFDTGEKRRGKLNEQGKAHEENVPTCGHELFFYPDENDAAIEAQRQALYQQAIVQISDWAKAFRDDLFAASQQPSSTTNEQYRQSVAEDFRAAVAEKIAELKAQKEAFEKLGEWEQFWENSKSVGEGVVVGITDYVPDLGEFGTLMDELNVDTTALINAIAFGDVNAMERKLQEWGKRGKVGFEEATLAMEALIILVSDEESRALLASMPLKFLEVTPEDQLVEIGVAQGTQTGIDMTLVSGATAAGAAAGGVGAPIAGGAALAGTLLRKSGKFLEAIIKTLMGLVKVLKKKRNKNLIPKQGYNPEHPEKTNLPQGGKAGRKNDKKKHRKAVKPTIGVAKTTEEIACFDKPSTSTFKPEVLTLSINGGQKTYSGKGTLQWNPYHATLYLDINCKQKLSNNQSFTAGELRDGITVYVKPNTVNETTFTLDLEKKAEFDVGKQVEAKITPTIKLTGTREADLCLLAKNCDDKIDNEWQSAKTTTNCAARGTKKHKCSEKAINAYQQKNPNSGIHSEARYAIMGQDENGDDIVELLETDPSMQEEARKAANAKRLEVRTENDYEGERKNVYQALGLNYPTSGRRFGSTSLEKKAREQRKKTKLTTQLNRLARIEKASNSQAAQAYRSKGGAKFIPDVVMTKDKTKPPVVGRTAQENNIDLVYDFKFNCPNKDGVPSEGYLDPNQAYKYEENLKLDTKVQKIHPNSKECKRHLQASKKK